MMALRGSASCTFGSLWIIAYFTNTRKDEAFDVNKLMYCKTCKNRLYSIKNQSGIPTSSIIEHVVAENDPMEIDEDDDKLCLKNLKYVEVKSNCCIMCNLNVSLGMILMPQVVS